MIVKLQLAVGIAIVSLFLGVGGVKGQDTRKADSSFLEAVKWRIANKPESAQAAYETTLSYNPNHAAACYGMASMKAEQNRWSEAVIYGEKAARLEPDNKWYKILLNKIYKTTMNLPKAVEVLGQLRKMDTTDIETAYQQADLYFMQGDIKSSIQVYDELEKMFEMRDEWSMQKYKLYTRLGNTVAAKAEIEKISKHIPGEVKYYEILAQACMQEQNYPQAYQYYKKVLEMKPEDPYTYAALADYYRKLKDEEKALSLLLQAVSQPSLDSDTRLNLVSTFFKDNLGSNPTQNEVKLYGLLLDTLMSMYPDMSRLYYTKGMFFIQQDKDSASYDMLSKCVELEPKDYNAHIALLYLKQKRMEWAGVVNEAETALKFFPESAILYVYLTSAYYNMTDKCDSVIYYGKQSLARIPYVAGPEQKQWWSVVYSFMGDCYFKAKDYGSYKKLMDEALVNMPDDPYIKNNYAYQLSMMNERLDEALVWTKQICEEHPNVSSFWDTYAWVLFQKKMYSLSFTAIKNAIKYNKGSDAVILEHLGDIIYHLNKEKKAVEAWKKAKELYGSEIPQNSVLLQKIEKEKWIETPYFE